MAPSFPLRGPLTVFWFLKIFGGLFLALRVALHFLGVWPAGGSPFPQLFGQFWVLLGAGVNLRHYVFLKRNNPDVASPDFLVASRGLYQWIRHPMYLGDLILMVGLTLLAPGPVSFLLLGMGTVGIAVQSRIEDEQMVRRFGPAFEDWRDRTRLLVPGVF
ncbi:MAG: methyltransferase family protein [Desulfococcaceae bacterium]